MGTLENPGKEGENEVCPPLLWEGVPGSQEMGPGVGQVRGLCWTSDPRGQNT